MKLRKTVAICAALAAVVAISVFTARVHAAPTVHQSSLSWSQSTTTGLTGNCVYRGSVSGGPYTQIFCSTAPSTAYVDASVTSGQTYYYVVTAVAGSEESQYSNEVKVTVPLSPAAPSGLSATAQ